MTPTETFTHNDLTIEIHYDADTESPRESFRNLGVILCCGDYAGYSDSDYAEATLLNEFRESPAYNPDGEPPYKDLNDADTLLDLCERGGFIALPVYIYGNETKTLQTTPFSCAPHLKPAGIIFTVLKYIQGAFDAELSPDELKVRVLQALEREIEDFNQYENLNIFGYAIKDKNGKSLALRWGFYGLERCKDAAASMAIELFNERYRKRCNRLKALIRNKAPLSIRQRILQEGAA